MSFQLQGRCRNLSPFTYGVWGGRPSLGMHSGVPSLGSGPGGPLCHARGAACFLRGQLLWGHLLHVPRLLSSRNTEQEQGKGHGTTASKRHTSKPTDGSSSHWKRPAELTTPRNKSDVQEITDIKAQDSPREEPAGWQAKKLNHVWDLEKFIYVDALTLNEW